MEHKRSCVMLPLLIIAGSVFYWYAVRPSRIKKKCSEYALREARARGAEGGLPDGRYDKNLYDAYYRRCRREQGM